MRRSIIMATLLASLLPLTVEAQRRIRFARGRTSATITESIARNADRSFVLGAKSGQTISGNISSTGDCVKFDNGTTSLIMAADQGSNFITLENECRRPVSFTFTISINNTD